MGNITLAVYDEHRLVREGISSLLNNVKDMEIMLQTDSKNKLLDQLMILKINVLIINVHILSIQLLNLMMQVGISHPKVMILVISVHSDEETVLKIIKAGAKGFLSKETERNELIEAIYTLRNGHDYFSKSITSLLLNKYVNKLKSDDGSADISNLSVREIEILRLWGSSLTNKEIADKLFLSVRTVETHKNHIMQKLNLKTSVDMIKFAIRNNIIDI
ncbi:MAG: response regulator transcription factor [Bacteroidales bacterium]|nr:response regulator transcription factor [Bacteroidales bacterium]